MKKLFLFFGIFLFTFAFVGCGTSQEDQTREDVLATQVSSILTETAMEEALPPTQTEIPLASETPMKPSQTPTEYPTETSTATPTEELSDPAVMLGAPAWTYDFSGSSSPWDYESEEANFETSNGFLNISARTKPNYHSWWVSSPKLKDAYVEMKVEMETCSGSDRFGFAVRASSAGDQFYFLALTCDGRWGFFRMAPGVEINEVEPYQDTDGVLNSWTEPHRVGIWMDGADFRFFIDGEEIGDANDGTLDGEGYTGFLIAYSATSGYTVRVDQLQYWNIP